MGESSSDAIGNVSWTTSLEEYFAQTGEKANGLGIMHKKAESLYSRRKTYIDLPVIIGSGAIGFLNAGSSSLFQANQYWASVSLGVASFVVGILNTIGTYYGWSKRAEGHRMSAIHYSKLYRFINLEMRLPRDERMQPSNFLKYVKDQYDRLAELSPPIPSRIIRDFNAQMNKYKDISKPEETNGLNKIKVFVDNTREFNGSVEPLSLPTPRSEYPKSISSIRPSMSGKTLKRSSVPASPATSPPTSIVLPNLDLMKVEIPKAPPQPPKEVESDDSLDSTKAS